AGCRVDAAVRVSGLGGAALSAPFVAACPLALALQRHAIATLAPAAREELGSPIVRIDHLGSFACRRVRGRPNGPLSQHAFARALDVTGYATADGRTIAIDADWPGTAGPTAAEGRFLRRVVARQAGWLAGPFTSVITPDRDARHRDHIHFGLRPPRR
ncbi:MAG: extensin family protein, partial [Cucumibacter sp.]